jgi:cytochrome c biogenesis protein CcmG/thiol:disulfide interchange protein DsbE
MAALVAGVVAPDFTLPTLDGKKVTLSNLLEQGPVVLAFFKVSCPVCQYAFPLYERMARANKDAGVTVLGISQNGPSDATAFAREYGVTFPIAIDNDANRYVVSNAYGLTNVPTLFYISPDGEIEVSSVGWSKRDVDEVNAKLAALRGQKPSVLWRASESVQEFRPG